MLYFKDFQIGSVLTPHVFDVTCLLEESGTDYNINKTKNRQMKKVGKSVNPFGCHQSCEMVSPPPLFRPLGNLNWSTWNLFCWFARANILFWIGFLMQLIASNDVACVVSYVYLNSLIYIYIYIYIYINIYI
jgi:hypothetical protein